MNRTTTLRGSFTRAAAPAPGGADTALIAADGRHLAATWHEPPAGPARAVAVVSSAAGVPRGYYRAFAGWLAARGCAVLTYDYRGIGGSRRGALRDETATMADWAVLDMSAALAAAEARRGTKGLPLLLVGHSFGGGGIGLAAGVERADAILTVASQLGESRLFPGPYRLLAAGFLRGWVPAVVALAGHLPGPALGPGAMALPRGVALQWSRWSGTPGWAYGDPALQRHRRASAVAAPVHLWNVSDDLTYAPPRAVDALAAVFRNAPVQRHTVTPADAGLRRLGHFGAFRRDAGVRLWPRLLAPLGQASPLLARALRP
jgi:predicted alpha/beta hydrolase